MAPIHHAPNRVRLGCLRSSIICKKRVHNSFFFIVRQVQVNAVKKSVLWGITRTWNPPSNLITYMATLSEEMLLHAREENYLGGLL